MTMEFEELAALDAAGALTAAERAEFERALAEQPAAVRAEIAELRDLMASVSGLLSDIDAPSPAVRERLLAGLEPQSPTTAPKPTAPEGFTFRFADENDWRPIHVPGIKMRILSRNDDKGYATLLLDVAPGARFPAHHHGGAEECYVISGSVVACGQRLRPGDFHHADAGSDHEELWTDEGCRVLLVVDPRDYFHA